MRAYSHALQSSRAAYYVKLNELIEDGITINWENFNRLKLSYEDAHEFDNYDFFAFYDFFKNIYDANRSSADSEHSTIEVIPPNIDCDHNSALVELNKHWH